MSLRAPVCFPDISSRFLAQIVSLSDALLSNLDALLLQKVLSGAAGFYCRLQSCEKAVRMFSALAC